jgi:hypothetical protein
MLVILANASLLLGFIDAYIPGGMVWSQLLHFPLPVFWLFSLVILGMEVLFFIKVRKMNLATR